MLFNLFLYLDILNLMNVIFEGKSLFIIKDFVNIIGNINVY